MVRVAAQWDPARYEAMYRTPLREVCLVAVQVVREKAQQDYAMECQLYAQGALKKRPKLPDFMRSSARWLM